MTTKGITEMEITHNCQHTQTAEIEGNDLILENGQCAEILDFDDNSGKYAICPICNQTTIIS